MAAEVQIKTEPEETETNEEKPDLSTEQPDFALNPIFGDQFVGIKQEVKMLCYIFFLGIGEK